VFRYSFLYTSFWCFHVLHVLLLCSLLFSKQNSLCYTLYFTVIQLFWSIGRVLWLQTEASGSLQNYRLTFTCDQFICLSFPPSVLRVCRILSPVSCRIFLPHSRSLFLSTCTHWSTFSSSMFVTLKFCPHSACWLSYSSLCSYVVKFCRPVVHKVV
jgi:hypothetical protein